MNKEARLHLIDCYLKLMRLPYFDSEGRERIDYETFDQCADAIRTLASESNLLEEWDDEWLQTKLAERTALSDFGGKT